MVLPAYMLIFLHTFCPIAQKRAALRVLQGSALIAFQSASLCLKETPVT